MTTTSASSLDTVVAAVAPPAPAERLAAFRSLLAGFTLIYLLVRSPAVLALADNSDDRFVPVGVLGWLSAPLPTFAVPILLGIAVLTAALALIGYRYVVVGPVFAASVLALLTYRSSWGQILWFDVVLALHVVIVGLSPAADVLVVERGSSTRSDDGPPSTQSRSYGWPLTLAALVTVSTYVVSGIAKLKEGGLEWVTGDSLRNHVAFSAARLDVFGETSSPLADVIVGQAWLAPPMAAVALALELGAPIALIGGRVRTGWVIGIWVMHLVIAATMFVVFAYQLVGIAFAPLFALERLVGPVRTMLGRVGSGRNRD